MDTAIGETNRRRAVQEAYNTKHGITPQSIIKAIKDLAEGREKKVEVTKIDPDKVPPEELMMVIKRLEIDMDLASQQLEFEKAAELRDQVEALRALQREGKKYVRK